MFVHTHEDVRMCEDNVCNKKMCVRQVSVCTQHIYRPLFFVADRQAHMRPLPLVKGRIQTKLLCAAWKTDINLTRHLMLTLMVKRQAALVILGRRRAFGALGIFQPCFECELVARWFHGLSESLISDGSRPLPCGVLPPEAILLQCETQGRAELIGGHLLRTRSARDLGRLR